MKAFLRRPGGVDHYPTVHVKWQLHMEPTLHARDAANKSVSVDLAPLSEKALHNLFAMHFEHTHVDPPTATVRMLRRLFGWAYGMTTFESAMFFCAAGVVLLVLCYVLCFRYTEMCDKIQDF